MNFQGASATSPISARATGEAEWVHPQANRVPSSR